MTQRRRTAALVLSVLTAVGGVSLLAEPAGAAGQWRVQTPVASTGDVRESTFLDVAAVSSTSAWAVGYADLTTKAVYAPIVAHRTSGSWHRYPAPALTTGEHPQLSGVRATTAAGLWVVGGAKFPGRKNFNNFVSHRVGGHWVNHDLGAGSELADVRILGANDVWVLYTRVSGSTGATKVGVGEHWNGRAWTKIRLAALPSYGGGSGRWSAAWAPGTQTRELLYWTGARWTVMRGPKITRSPRSSYYSSILVRGDTLFVAVAYDLGEGGPGGSDLFARDSKGSWHHVLAASDTYSHGVTRTSADGVWWSGDRHLLHIVGGRVVSSATPPDTFGHPTYLSGVSGTVRSAAVFAIGNVQQDGFPVAVAVAYRP